MTVTAQPAADIRVTESLALEEPRYRRTRSRPAWLSLPLRLLARCSPATGSAGFVTGYAEVFRRHPEITSIVHVHTPWLGGWAQTHRTLRIKYAASQRLTLSRDIPPHIDRSQSPGNFILDRLVDDPDLVATFEANGGVNVIGRDGLLELAKFVVLLEEGAQYQALGELVGGTVDFDKTNLVAQWGRSGLLDEARRRGLV